MATKTITWSHYVAGVLTDATSVYLSDPDSTYGVKRNDTQAVVVADNTAMTHAATGVYTYSFTEPALDLEYTAYVEWTYSGLTHRQPFTLIGTRSGSLTTLSRVKEYLNITASTYDTKLTNLLAVASAAVENYCDCALLSTARTEYFNGGATPYLTLRSAPVTASPVLSVATDAVQVTNTSTSVQSARVSVDSGIVTLTRVASGVSTSDTLAASTYTTLSTLAAAVTALGNGWAGTVLAAYSGYASANVRDTQGSLDASNGNTAVLQHFVEGYERVRCNPTTGTVWVAGRLPCGFQNVKVSYTGGYSTVPEPIQGATCALTAALYRMSDTDQTLQSERLGDYGYSLRAGMTASLASISPDAALLLQPFKRPRL